MKLHTYTHDAITMMRSHAYEQTYKNHLSDVYAMDVMSVMCTTNPIQLNSLMVNIQTHTVGTSSLSNQNVKMTTLM